MELPGANKLKHGPMLLKLLVASLSEELEPTVMAEGAEAGLMVQASAPRLLPAAMTGTMPAAATAAGNNR